MTDEKKDNGGGEPPRQGDHREGGRRPSRGDRRGRGRRRRGSSRGAAEGAAQERQSPAGERQTPRPADRQAPANLVAYLARAGVGSRRRCDEIIRAGRVTINGEAVDFPRQKLQADDVVAVDGETVEARELRYVLLNKPRGVASTRSDPHAERLVVDLVPDGRVLFPVGRLDVDTTGLILLTNDGPLAHRLMHPSYGVPKTYVVRVRGRVGRREVAELRRGVELEDGMTAPADARLLKQGNKSALVELIIHQGRKRQVRRMFAALGLHVEELQRRRYGPLSDGELAAGEWRDLTGEEVDALRRAAEHVETCVGGEPVEEGVSLAAEEKPERMPAGPAGETAAASGVTVSEGEPPDASSEDATAAFEMPDEADTEEVSSGAAADEPAGGDERDAAGQALQQDEDRTEPVADAHEEGGPGSGAAEDDEEAPSPPAP
jgi:23S rRNA pseudouridine2605 synthase